MDVSEIQFSEERVLADAREAAGLQDFGDSRFLEGLRLLLEELSPRDTVALVVYAGAAGRVLEPTSAREMSRIAAAIESYEKALDLYDDFHFARKNLAIVCDLFLGDAACALENYERYAQSVPGNEQVTTEAYADEQAMRAAELREEAMVAERLRALGYLD